MRAPFLRSGTVGLGEKRTCYPPRGEGSHFDKVIEDIEKMISKLRDEEQSDIDHKDWCESERNKANTANEDLEYAKDSYAGECWKQGGTSLFA